MAAVLGGEREVVVAALAELGLTPANENGAGQIVAAGPLAQIEILINNPPAGARVRPLQVSGAFHTQVMAPAVAALEELLPSLSPTRARAPIFSNKEGALISDGSEFLNRIVGQVSGSVRWDLCMSALKGAGVTGVLELAPGGTLVGLLKRAEPEIAGFALKSPADLPAAAEFISAHRK
jgi:[acyl-carrier-protein] S-malonyltransferase